MTSDTVVIIPARNEEGTIASLVRTIRREHGLPVVVVDDMSTDATAANALAAGATLLPLRIHLGAWGASQAGFRYALQQGYSYCLTIDGDGQHLPEMIPGLMAEIRANGTDIVIGSCPERGSMSRRLAWSMFRGITGFAIADMTSGFRVYTRKAMEILTSSSAALLDYQDVGVLLLLRKQGVTIRELGVCMLPRICGHSRVFCTWFDVAHYMARTTLLCLSKMSVRQTFKRQSEQ